MQIVIWIFWGIVLVWIIQAVMPLIAAFLVILPMLIVTLVGLAIAGSILLALLAAIGWLFSALFGR
jgi:hypothetical protein